MRKKVLLISIQIIFIFSFINGIAQENNKNGLYKVRALYRENKINETIIAADSLQAINSDLWMESQLLFFKAKAMFRLNKQNEVYPLVVRINKIGKELKNDSIIIYSNVFFHDYYNNSESKEKAVDPILENIKILKNKNLPVSKAELATMYGLLGNFYREKDSLNYGKYIKLMYDSAQKIDTTYIRNVRLLGYIYSNYADYLNRYESQEKSYIYYVKSNRCSHKGGDTNLINFTRTRIAGCLTNFNKPFQAIDTLRVTQREKHVDVFTNQLMYEGFIRAFERANMPDSVTTYKILFDDFNKILNTNDVSSTDAEAIKVPENNSSFNLNSKNNSSLFTYTLICCLVLGSLIVFYIIKNTNSKN